MRTVTPTELLRAWEWGLSQSPVHRALMLLRLADPDKAPEQLAQLAIGQRDAQLLRFHESTFGSQITGQAACPACGLEVELNFTVADVLVTPLTEPAGAFTVSIDDHEVSFRLPNTQDLEALPASGDPSALARWLLQRCVLHARHNGQSIPIHNLPKHVAAAISERMEESDPQGDVQLALKCPQCAHGWRAPLDIISFLWTEIHAWAVRLLREVHVLASTYGWRECEILAMTPWRRQAYLELIGQ